MSGEEACTELNSVILDIGSPSKIDIIPTWMLASNQTPTKDHGNYKEFLREQKPLFTAKYPFLTSSQIDRKMRFEWQKAMKNKKKCRISPAKVRNQAEFSPSKALFGPSNNDSHVFNFSPNLGPQLCEKTYGNGVSWVHQSYTPPGIVEDYPNKAASGILSKTKSGTKLSFGKVSFERSETSRDSSHSSRNISKEGCKQNKGYIRKCILGKLPCTQEKIGSDIYSLSDSESENEHQLTALQNHSTFDTQNRTCSMGKTRNKVNRETRERKGTCQKPNGNNQAWNHSIDDASLRANSKEIQNHDAALSDSDEERERQLLALQGNVISEEAINGKKRKATYRPKSRTRSMGEARNKMSRETREVKGTCQKLNVNNPTQNHSIQGVFLNTNRKEIQNHDAALSDSDEERERQLLALQGNVISEESIDGKNRKATHRQKSRKERGKKVENSRQMTITSMFSKLQSFSGRPHLVEGNTESKSESSKDILSSEKAIPMMSICENSEGQSIPHSGKPSSFDKGGSTVTPSNIESADKLLKKIKTPISESANISTLTTPANPESLVVSLIKKAIKVPHKKRPNKERSPSLNKAAHIGKNVSLGEIGKDKKARRSLEVRKTNKSHDGIEGRRRTRSMVHTENYESPLAEPFCPRRSERSIEAAEKQITSGVKNVVQKVTNEVPLQAVPSHIERNPLKLQKNNAAALSASKNNMEHKADLKKEELRNERKGDIPCVKENYREEKAKQNVKVLDSSLNIELNTESVHQDHGAENSRQEFSTFDSVGPTEREDSVSSFRKTFVNGLTNTDKNICTEAMNKTRNDGEIRKTPDPSMTRSHTPFKTPLDIPDNTKLPAQKYSSLKKKGNIVEDDKDKGYSLGKYCTSLSDANGNQSFNVASFYKTNKGEKHEDDKVHSLEELKSQETPTQPSEPDVKHTFSLPDNNEAGKRISKMRICDSIETFNISSSKIRNVKKGKVNQVSKATKKRKTDIVENLEANQKEESFSFDTFKWNSFFSDEEREVQPINLDQAVSPTMSPTVIADIKGKGEQTPDSLVQSSQSAVKEALQNLRNIASPDSLRIDNMDENDSEPIISPFLSSCSQISEISSLSLESVLDLPKVSENVAKNVNSRIEGVCSNIQDACKDISVVKDSDTGVEPGNEGSGDYHLSERRKTVHCSMTYGKRKKMQAGQGDGLSWVSGLFDEVISENKPTRTCDEATTDVSDPEEGKRPQNLNTNVCDMFEATPKMSSRRLLTSHQNQTDSNFLELFSTDQSFFA